MNPVVSTTVHTIPVPQPRQRHGRIKTAGGTDISVNFTPRNHPVQQFKVDVREAVLKELPTFFGLLTGPLALECKFYLPRPKRLMRRRDPDGPIWHTGKPDLDNLYKAVMDALKGQVWHDDNQVATFGPDHGKWYAERAGRPRVELKIWQLPDSVGGTG